MAAEPTHASQRERSQSPRKRYDLATALRVVRNLETSESRLSIFEEIKKKNVLYQVVDTLYSLSGKLVLQPLILWAYMLKCVLIVGPFRDELARVATLANYPNEKRTIERVSGLISNTPIEHLSMDRRHFSGRGQFKAALRMILLLPRTWSFLRALVRRHEFMPAARIASTLAFYVRFEQFMEDHPHVKCVIVASNYSPEAVALAAAAHETNRNVLYANHAPVPANCAVVPPVYSDCALLYGIETEKTYKCHSTCTAEVVLIGQPGRSSVMRWTGRLRKVGIFLTAQTRVDTLSDLVQSIRATHPDVDILIRDHPVALLRNDLTALVTDDPRVEVSIGNPLDAEIEACDLILCGNSGVALNALRGGRPVAYLAALDDINYDYNGFVSSGLVHATLEWSAGIYEVARSFYSAPRWCRVMNRYDASYGADLSELLSGAAKKIETYMKVSDAEHQSARSSLFK